MIVNTIYKVSSNKQLVELDDVSTSPNKVSKQVMLVENELPEEQVMKQLMENTSTGVVLIVDVLDAESYETFDTVIGSENDLNVIEQKVIDNTKAVLCCPENFLTLYTGLELYHKPKIFNISVVTLSDRAYRGIYEDRSGPEIVNRLTTFFGEIGKNIEVNPIIIPDDENELSLILEESKLNKVDLVITTGGTGIGLRDITVEVVQKHLTKEIPGIMEMIRMKYGSEKPNALLSRGVAGTMNQTLIYTLPGSVKAVNEYLTEIFKTLDHLFYMLHGIDKH